MGNNHASDFPLIKRNSEYFKINQSKNQKSIINFITKEVKETINKHIQLKAWDTKKIISLSKLNFALYFNKTIQTWEISPENSILKFKGELTSHKSSICDFCYLNDFSHIISIDIEGFLKFWDYTKGYLIATISVERNFLKGNFNSYSLISFNPNPFGKKLIACYSSYRHSNVTFWEFHPNLNSENRLIKKLPITIDLYNDCINQIIYIPNSCYFFCCSKALGENIIVKKMLFNRKKISLVNKIILREEEEGGRLFSNFTFVIDKEILVGIIIINEQFSIKFWSFNKLKLIFQTKTYNIRGYYKSSYFNYWNNKLFIIFMPKEKEKECLWFISCDNNLRDLINFNSFSQPRTICYFGNKNNFLILEYEENSVKGNSFAFVSVL